MIINDIYFNVDLIDVLHELRNQLALNGIDLMTKIKEGPDNIQVCCPYHNNGQERKPSAGIKKSNGIFHCFACQETHTLPEVISYCFGKDDIIGSFGWQWLVKNFSVVPTEERKDLQLDFDRHKKKSTIKYVSEEELDRYRYYHKYWEQRGITDEYTIELFDLGFDKDTNCITFPVRNKEGYCLFIARRNVYTKFFNYPSGVEKPLYGLYELYKDGLTGIKSSKKHILGYPYSLPRDLFVCESMIDCILLWQAGHYAVALNGLGNQLQMKQLRELPCRKLILATDNDLAGDKARERIRSEVSNKLISEIIFPDNIKDIGECSQEEIINILDWEEFV